MTIQTFAETVESFNTTAELAFDKQYQAYQSALKEFAFKYNSGATSSSNFYINLLFGSSKEWLGTQEYTNIDKVIKQAVINKEYYVEGIEFPVRDFKRAQQTNSITGLDMYVKNVSSLSKIAADSPYKTMLKYLKAGAGTTLGTCFDSEPLFSANHAFSNVAGTQSNLITGTGITVPQLIADIQSTMASMLGYYYSINTGSGEDEDTRMLNESPKYVIFCSPSLAAKIGDIKNLSTIIVDGTAGSQDNPLRNSFEIVTRHIDIANPNDYYILDVSESNVKPFLISMEDEGNLLTPQDNLEALSNQQSIRYAFNGLSYGNAYGAWWKIAKVNNA